MYALINKHIQDLLNYLHPVKDIDPYIDLRTKLPHVDVSTDQDFQKIYKKYWQLNAARLSASWCAVYFGHLETLKNTQHVPTVDEISRFLFGHATNNKGRQSLQFSFSTKFVHMLNPTQPVYDSLIAQYYFLPSTTSKNERNERGEVVFPEQKLANLLNSYRFLETEHKRILSNGLLEASIHSFRQHFPLAEVFTDEKVIDTLIWQFVRFLRRGAIRKGIVVYS